MHNNREETIELRIISKLIDIIATLVSRKQSVKMVLLSSSKTNIIMALQIAANQKAPIVIGLIDADTLQPITAVSSKETEVSDNLAVATIDANNELVGVAPGSGNLTSTAVWQYTDKNTNQIVTTAPLTIITPFTVTAVVTAEKVQMVVTLDTPVFQ